MLKSGWPEADIPLGALKGSKSCENDGGKDYNDDDDDEDDEGEHEDDDDDDDEDADAKPQFEKGYLRRWWREASRLPSSMMPIFGLRHSFKDTFVTFEERALPAILWSSSKNHPNPAAAATCKIMSGKDAARLTETQYGELIRILFYGDLQEVKKSKLVWQTPYARRTTTMSALAESHPNVFDPTVLHTFLDEKFQHIAKAKDSKERGIPCEGSPPALPTTRLPQEPSLRYAINNILSTNGTELNINCFDTRKPHRKQRNFVPIQRIEKRFPTNQSILDEFGVASVDEIDVWGIDPGEVNTAAFCRVVRGQPAALGSAASTTILGPGVEVKNLAINRMSLYQPVLAHRQKMNELSSKRMTVTEGQHIEGSLWAKDDDDAIRGNGVSLPSISDVQNTLPSRQHTKVDDIEHSTKKFSQVQGLLHGFHSAKRVKRMDWSLKKAKKAEVDRAVNAILKDCHTKTLFCYGNGSFRTGIN